MTMKYLRASWCSAIVAGAMTVSACGGDSQAQMQKLSVDDDVIAQVGNERITYSELNTMLNSSAMVGLSVPSLGTPERNKVMMTLLDKVISANLLYLDAQNKGTDRLTSYQKDVERFEDAMIATLYRDRIMIGEIEVPDADIQAFFDANFKDDDELTDELGFVIEAKLRKLELEKRKASLRDRLRVGCAVESARYLDAEGGWEVQLAGGETLRARAVVSGLGQLNLPNIPEFEGADSFKGETFHSARWRHDVDLSGKPTDSVNRWILRYTESIPKTGDQFIIDELEILVEKASKRCIQQVRIRRPKPQIVEDKLEELEILEEYFPLENNQQSDGNYDFSSQTLQLICNSVRRKEENIHAR